MANYTNIAIKGLNHSKTYFWEDLVSPYDKDGMFYNPHNNNLGEEKPPEPNENSNFLEASTIIGILLGTIIGIILIVFGAFKYHKRTAGIDSCFSLCSHKDTLIENISESVPEVPLEAEPNTNTSSFYEESDDTCF